MKQHIVLLMSVLMVALGLGTSAFAQDVCPEGTMKVIQPDTQAVFCIANLTPADAPAIQDEAQEVEEAQEVPDQPEALEAPVNPPRPRMAPNRPAYDSRAEAQKKRTEALNRRAMEEEQRKDVIGQYLTKGGLAFDFGLGYAMYAAFHLRFMIGYHFQQKLDGLSFGLYTDLGLNFGAPNSVDWAVVPMFHVNGRIFRFSLGFGLGTFTIWDSDNNEGGTGTWFQLKPEIRFDWFLSRRAYMGFGFDTPLVFSRLKGGITEVTPWYSMNIHVGFKY